MIGCQWEVDVGLHKAHKYLYLKNVDTVWHKWSRNLATKYRVIKCVNRGPGVIGKWEKQRL